MEDFVADSEEEAQLRLSASISPRRALESAFSRDITNDTGIKSHFGYIDRGIS